ncbi:tetratricopeptide repeat protein [candidate division KSB1 bacterium]|nr:tetratricopeptide repeat protein [candidate division KSB1 bacterium]
MRVRSMNIKYSIKFIPLLIIMSFLFCSQSEERRKIKLSNEGSVSELDEQMTTTIHLEPQNRRSIAVMFFKNLTGDENLEWLQQGLTEMFIRALSQSSSISVLSTDRLIEIVNRLGESRSPKDIDMDIAAVVAKEANVEAVLVGKITRHNNALRISVKLQEPNKGMIIKEESVEGPGLEKIFNMVDELTQQIKSDLHLALEKEQAEKGIADLSTNSIEAWRHYMAGVEYGNKMMHVDAAAEFEKAVAIDSTFISALIQLANSKKSRKDIDEAYKIFEKLQGLKEGATDQEKYEIDLLDAMLHDNFQRYISILKEKVEKYPEDREANIRLANLYFSLHNYERAIDYYKRIIKIDPNYKLAYNQLGYTYAHCGMHEKAVEILKKYMKIAPDEPNPYDSLGEIYLYRGEYEKAKEYFEKALDVNATFDHAWEHLGATEMDQGNYADALKMTELHAKNTRDEFHPERVNYVRAKIYYCMGKYDAAIQELEKDVKNPAIKRIMAELQSKIYLSRGDKAAARQALEENYEQLLTIIESNPGRSYPITNLFVLSFNHEINIDKTIEIVDNYLSGSDELNDADKLQWKFFLSLLFIKKGNINASNAVWEEFSVDDMLLFLREVRSINYSDNYKYHLYMNKAYAETPEHGLRFYETLISRLMEQNLKTAEIGFRLCQANFYKRIGNEDEVKDQLKIAGMPAEDKWMLIGPFKNKNGFHREFIDEENASIRSKVKIADESLTWIRSNDGIHDGFINMGELFDQDIWQVAYGLTYINAPRAMDVQFRVGTDESVKIWLNDEEIWKYNVHRNAILDDDVIRVKLKPGLNKVLVKVCNRMGDWGFYFRVTDENGNGIQNIEYVAADSQV